MSKKRKSPTTKGWMDNLIMTLKTYSYRPILLERGLLILSLGSGVLVWMKMGSHIGHGWELSPLYRIWIRLCWEQKMVQYHIPRLNQQKFFLKWKMIRKTNFHWDFRNQPLKDMGSEQKRKWMQTKKEKVGTLGSDDWAEYNFQNFFTCI